MFRPGGFSDSEEDSDSGLEVSPIPRVTGQNYGGGGDPGHQVQVVKEEEMSRSVLFDLAQSVEAGDLDSVGGRTAPGD